MNGQLESTLILALRETMPWESALDETVPGIRVSETGTLHPVGPSDPFRPESFQFRDRQLAYRDLIVAAAVVETSVQMTDVWNFAAPRPLMQGPASALMPSIVTDQLGNTDSTVRHAANSWVPYDAADRTDKDLYGRDGLVYEILARACGTIFTDPPIPRLDPTGTVFQDTVAWSLASGTHATADISGGLHLNRELFGRPDRNLADRDNQLAGYAARLAKILNNPFAYANRLYVRTTGTPDVRESEVYILTSDDDFHRTWRSEPALSNRNQIVYDKNAKTLLWTRERSDSIHTPQVYALSVPGIDGDQTLETVPAVPERKDVQFWRARAGRVIPYGGSLSDSITMAFTATPAVSGGQPQVSCASFTVPASIKITLPGSVAAGPHRIAVLAVPNPVVEIPGIQNTSGTPGSDGGATYPVDVASGSLGNRAYYVEGGNGIVYKEVTYLPGQVFYANGTDKDYTQVSTTHPSQVRQYSVNWQVALPRGNWVLQIEYTNLAGSTNGFGIEARYKPLSGNEVTIIKDAPQFLAGANGDLVLTHEGHFSPEGTPFTLNVFWTYGTGQLHIRRLVFRNLDIPTCRISMDGILNTGAGSVEVVGKAYQPETLLFDVVNGAQTPPVIELRMNGNVDSDSLLPVQIKQVVVQTMGVYNSTPDSAGFQGWRQECLDRSERILQQTYGEIVVAYGGTFPVFYGTGTGWDWRNSDAWMSLLETRQARLRELPNVPSNSLSSGHQYQVVTGPVTYDSVTYNTGESFYATQAGGATFSGGQIKQIGAFRRSSAGHIGKPCLIPMGLEFSGSLATLACSGSLASPAVVACQPWMIDRGLYTAHEEFWMPTSL